MTAMLKSRLALAIALVAVVVGLYALIGFQFAPDMVREQAQKVVREKYGRELTVGEIRIHPFKLQVDIRDLALPDADGQPMLGFARLFVDLQLSSLWNRAFTFEEVSLEAPKVRAVIRPDGRVNLADLAGPPKPEAPASPGEPLPSIWIHKLGVGQGLITFIDRTRRQSAEGQLRDVGFELADFRTTPEGGDFNFSARSADGASLEWKGHFALAPVISSRGDFKLSTLRVPALAELLGDVLPFSAKTGTLNLAGSYRVALAEQVELELSLPTADLRDLALAARGVDAPWITIPSVVVSGTKLALPARAITVDRVAVGDAQAQVWLNEDRSVNLQALFSPTAATGTETAPSAAPSPAAAPTSPPGSPWTVKIADVVVKNAALDVEDRAIAPGTRFKVAPLDLQVSNASLDLTQPLPLTLAAVINDHASVEAQGSVTPGPLAASLDIRLAKARVATLQPYVLPLAALTITSGELGITGRFDLAPPGGKAPTMSFAGDVAMDGFASVDNERKRDFLNFTRLQLDKLRYTAGPDALGIDRITVTEPYARVIIGADQVINIAAVLDPQGTAKAVAKAAEKPAGKAATKTEPPRAVEPPAGALPIRVGEVRIDRMRMNFTDNFIQPNFAADVRQLSGTVTGLSTARDARAKVDLKGNLGEFSPVSINGELQAFAFDRYTDMKLRFENIPLPIFNPYSGSLAGYNIDKGQLTTDLHYRIESRRLDAQHKIRVDQLEWGEATATKGKATLPVKFATSLLKDRNGVINLDVPVGGTLDDPTFRIGPIVWQIIGNLITKAVTAPFALLGSLAKGAEEAQFVDFVPGDAKLDPALAGRLAALGKSLVEKPSLKLDVPFGTSRELDGPALAERAYEAALSEGLASRKGGKPGAAGSAYATLEPAGKVELLTALLKARNGTLPPLPELARPLAASASAAAASASATAAAAQTEAAAVEALERALRSTITVAETELAELGKDRALAVERAVLAGTGLEPARVFKVRVGKVSAREGKVRLELGLE